MSAATPSTILDVRRRSVFTVRALHSAVGSRLGGWIRRPGGINATGMPEALSEEEVQDPELRLPKMRSLVITVVTNILAQVSGILRWNCKC
jgi:hypothetical protein